MKTNVSLIFLFVLFSSIQIFAQNNQPLAQPEQSAAVENISAELMKVSKSLQTFNKNFAAFLERLPQGVKFSEKQQNLLLAFEVLNRAEERVGILQKFQIELTDKQATVRTRLAQVEQEITPEGIDRIVALLGTTRTEEYRESRRRTLEAERYSLRQLAAQINQNLSDTSNEVRQAASFVKRLRDRILPQIEQEISNF
jgi:septal ring factor EnvC (AmiA/AmiB activator)